VAILVAEDNEAQRRYLVELLGRKFPGYLPLLEANEGESAVRLAVENRPELSIFDIQMPNLSGVKGGKGDLARIP
jgi:CheY-like chemotaxis protein